MKTTPQATHVGGQARKKPEELLEQYRDRQVVLVDEQDNQIGVAGLVEAHRGLGMKHRAFSLWLYRWGKNGMEVLLQKRAGEKPVFPHYWANTCCYNLAPGEEYLVRAVTRVKEEMGVVLPAGRQGLRRLYQFSYYAPDIEGWCENELDTVIVGELETGENTVSPLQITPNPEEVEEYQWMEWGELKRDVEENPHDYAPWFQTIMDDGRLERELLGE